MDPADQITDILHQLKRIRDYEGDPIRVKKPPNAAVWQAHVDEFHLEKKGAFEVTDTAVVEAARRMASKPHSGFWVVMLNDGYELWAFMDESKIRSIEKSKSGSCFVATAAFGSYEAPEVVYLSRFRDGVLFHSLAGRIFIRTYYSVGPFFASVIKSSDRLCDLSRRFVLIPMIAVLRVFYRA